MPFLYFVQAGGADGPVKIGYSGDVEKRLEALKTGNHLELTLRLKHEHDRAFDLERALHAELAVHRLEGEWFEHTPKLEHIIEILSGESSLLPPSARDRLRETDADVLDGSAFWAVQWSDRQQVFHIETLNEALLNNQLCLLDRRCEPNDYVTLFIARTRDQAHAIADVYDPVLRAMHVLRKIGALP
jgi:Meiotically up-regulated gene 113